MSTFASRVREEIEPLAHWDGHLAGSRLAALEAEGALSDPEAIAALARCARFGAVVSALERAPDAARLAGLGPVVAAPGALDPPSRPVARAAYRAALRRSGAAEDPSDAARPVAPAWRTAWPARPKRAKVAAPSVPARVERFLAPSTLTGGTGAEDDAAERDVRAGLAGSGRLWMWPLHRMSRARALAVWASMGPADTGVDASFWTLVPWLGVEGLSTSLAFAAADLSCLPALASLDSVRAAPLFAKGLASKRREPRQEARAWLARFPETAALGLVPELFGAAKEAEAADLALRWLRRHHADAFTAGLAAYAPEVQAVVLERLAALPGLPSKPPALPAFAEPALLPRPITPGGAALDPQGMRELLQLLAATPPEGGPWLDDVRAAFTEASLARLARALFDAWMLAGAPPKERWALGALAFFPDDEAAAELAEIAEQLAPQGHSPRAQEMTAVLGRMATRASLALVHRLARRVRGAGFKKRALEIFGEAAEAMGLTEEELAERLVPDFGLGAGATFPVEPPVRLARKGDGVALVDASGRPQKGWPTSDDEELTAQWKELKRRASPLLREAWARLERAVVTGRRMSRDHFGEVYLVHPLLSLASRGLVWAAWDARGARVRTFRVDDELGLRDADDRPTTLPDEVSVGCVHPAELSADERAGWQARLREQPFEQLARPAIAREASALAAQAARLLGRTLPNAEVFGLEAAGWARGPTEDGGNVSAWSWAVPGARLALRVTPGVNLGVPDVAPTQTIEALDVHVEPGATERARCEVERALQRVGARSGEP